MVSAPRFAVASTVVATVTRGAAFLASVPRGVVVVAAATRGGAFLVSELGELVAESMSEPCDPRCCPPSPALSLPACGCAAAAGDSSRR